MAHPYGWNNEDSSAAAVAARAACDEARRNAADVDQKARFPVEALDALAKSGLYGLCVDKAHGGLGLGPRAFAAVVEELSESCASAAMVYVMHVTAAQAIAAAKPLARREALLADVAAGRHLTTLAFSEKGSRSQFWAPVSKLDEKDGGFEVDAQKSWVTSAAKADSYVASAQAPQAASPLESTCFLVRKGASGSKITSRFDGLGLRGNDSAPVEFRRVRVAAGDLLSGQGHGAEMMLQVVLPWFAIGTAAMANGLCRAAVAATAKHLTESSFEHSGSRLCDLPQLRARLAQMSVRTELSRSLLGRTLGEMEAPSETTPLFVLQTRLAALEAALEVTDLAMKACGGAAFSKHLPLERLFRDARAGFVMAPTADHLADFVGKALTGMPLFG
jgi:alkylation response protein AidB-like acyl-CoA dehydrogenase